MKFFRSIALCVTVMGHYTVARLPHVVSHNPLMCDWTKIDVDAVTFPSNFGWGVATSDFQIAGTQTAHGKHIENIWTRAAQQGKIRPVGIAHDYWNRYKQDIKALAELGFKEYRFSCTWSAIMPHEDVFDAAAMDHYVAIVRTALSYNITPYIMLFHHEWPLWFDAKEAFANADNIDDFVRYATYVFTTLQAKLTQEEFKRITWMTFNEPVGYCLNAYFRGEYPPYKKDLKLAGTVVRNMLDAHVAVYHAYKKLDACARIGFAKIMVPIDPYNVWNPIEQLCCSLFDHLQNYAILSYFTTGTFTWGFPGYGRLVAKNEQAIGALDFLAINYYFNVMLHFHLGLKPRMTIETVPGRPVWAKQKSIYPEGLYRCVVNVAQKLPGVPLIIGENGIATDNAAWRNGYIKTHLYVVHCLLQEGYDIRGYHWWSIFDTYSWHGKGFSEYGLFAVDPVTHERRLRKDEGFKDFLHLVQEGVYHSA